MIDDVDFTMCAAPAPHRVGENGELKVLRAFILLYRRTYMETQIHPSIVDESRVMMKAREACEAFNIKEGE